MEIEVRGHKPNIAKDVFVAGNAYIVGDVVIGSGSSVWYNVAIRGDVAPIRIGKETNIQDGTVMHGSYGHSGRPKYGCTIHDRVTIGHMVVLHGCEVKSGCLIGMGSIVMDGAVVGENSLVGAGSLVTEGSVFPPRSLILGRPAKVKRELSDEEVKLLQESADNYLLYASWYK